MRSVGIYFVCILFSLGSNAGAADAKPRPIYELLQLRVEDGKPVLRTTIAPTPAEEVLSVNVKGFGEGSELTHTPADKSGSPPRFFRLDVRRDGPPVQRWTVTWTRDTLDIQWSTFFKGDQTYTRKVSLVSSPRQDVQLLITEVGSVPGRNPLSVHAREKDLPGLLRKYPAHVAEFLRPLMRELGQEAVFAPEARVAWQVFADRWVPDETIKKQIDTLLPQLNADAAADRDAAGEKLKGLGAEAGLVMMQLDREELTPEQNARLDGILAAHAPLPAAEAHRLRSDVSFLLDCLNSDDERLRVAAVERLQGVTARHIDFDVKLDYGFRAAAVAAVREKLTLAGVISRE